MFIVKEATLTDYSARKNIFRQQARCFLCLKSGHVLRNCRNTSYKCLNCHGRHHISICEKLQATIEGQGVARGMKTTVLGKRSSSDVSVTTGGNPTNVEKVTTGCKFVGVQGNSVLLQTAIAPVSSPCDSSIEIRARLIFDSCSQRSYVTSALKKELKLPVLGSQTLLLKTFGENTPKLQTCEVVQLCIRSIVGLNIYTTCYVVPQICHPVSCQVIDTAKAQYSYLQGLPLADNPTVEEQNEMPNDTLIGSDQYWAFIEGSIIQGDLPGPVAPLTKLGYVLSGPVHCQGNNQF